MSLPDALKKRSIIFGVKEMTPSGLAQIATEYEKVGELNDAVDFFARAKQNQDVERLLKNAVDEGDAFLVLKIFKLLEREIEEEALLRCAQRAEELSKTRYAIMAYERLGNEEKVSSLKESIKDDFDIKADVESTVFIPTVAEELDEE